MKNLASPRPAASANSPIITPRIRVTIAFPLAASTMLRQFGNISVGGPGFLVNYYDEEKALDIHYEITTVTRITLLQMNGGHRFKIAVASRPNSAPHIEGIRTCLLDTRHIYEISSHSVVVELQPIPNTTVRLWATNDLVFETTADGFIGDDA